MLDNLFTLYYNISYEKKGENMAKSKGSKNKTKKKSTGKKTLPKQSSKTVKKTITKSGSEKKKTIKKEVVNVKTMEVKKPNLPKKKEIKEEVKEEIKEKSFIDKVKDILVIKKKNRRKSNSKKIKKSKKQSLVKELKKTIRKIKMYGITSVIPVKSLVIIGIMFIIIIWFISFLLGFFTGEASMVLDNIPYDIDQLKTISYNIEDSNDIVLKSEAYGDLKDYYAFDFDKEFKLDSSYVEEYVIKLNLTKKQVYIAIKPTKNHNEDVKSVLEDYLKEKKITKYDYLDYSGYEFFIASNNNKLVISKIRQSQIRVFDALKELKSEDILEDLGIKSSLYDEALVKRAIIVDKNTGYYIFKATSRRHAKSIANIMDKYFNNLEKELKNKDTNEYELVKNRYRKIKGSMCIYIFSYDNELVEDLLQI